MGRCAMDQEGVWVTSCAERRAERYGYKNGSGLGMRWCDAEQSWWTLTGRVSSLRLHVREDGTDKYFSAQPSILVLLELHRMCPEIFDKLEVYIDGGFERGSDILKAISLGATAVGIGRPYLYSLTYGEEGVEHLTQSKFSGASCDSTQLIRD